MSDTRCLTASLTTLALALLIPIPATAADEGPALEYDWEEGMQYHCSFDLKTTVSNEEQAFHGVTIYTPVPHQTAGFNRVEPSQTCSGTAFAISRNGHLVTCAHVVEGATSIVAHFGSKSYAAEVLAYDADSDLAIVKVDADNLPVLGFCDSDKVELAQDIRVVGYPLSDVLGESVKMSRGTVAGIIKLEDENRFQIDAQVNPGNSGGPLVDEQGRVVGIASELLADESIDSVGFAIPSNEALRLAKVKGIAVELPPDGDKPNGPELARRVTPSVALLKVEIGPGGYAAVKKQMFMFHGFYSRRGFPVKDDSGRVTTDSRGEIYDCGGKYLLPLCLQPLGTIGIERLPGDSRTRWKSFRFHVVTLAVKTESDDPGLFAPGFGLVMPPRYRSPYDRLDRYRSPLERYSRRTEEVQIVPLPATEEIEYRRLDESEDGTVTISKKYRWYSVADKGSNTMKVDIELEGTFRWDKGLGGVSQSKMMGQITFAKDNITARYPIDLAYHVEKKKPKPANVAAGTPSATTPSTDSGPSVRKVEPARPTALEQAPSSTGLSKFNPDD